MNRRFFSSKAGGGESSDEDGNSYTDGNAYFNLNWGGGENAKENEQLFKYFVANNNYISSLKKIK